MGVGEEDLLVLYEEPSVRRAGRHAGLYHYALLFTSREELAHAALRLAETQTSIQGASDHGTHEAIYLPDPDGNGMELAADRPRKLWPRPLDYAGGPHPLDFDSLLATVAGEEPRGEAGPGLIVGHVHLHVGDLERGLGFYRDVLGFDHWTVMLDDPEEVEAVRERVRAAGIATEEREGGFLARDPWGIAVLFVPAQSLEA
jgi:catechol 2,3-dioxygenase